MNIHPAIVHFPIALLTLYAFFECVPFQKLTALREWFYIKTVLLFSGFAGALFATATGEFGEELYRTKWRIIEIHEAFAKGTTTIFGILSIIYAFAVIEKLFGEKIRSLPYSALWEFFVKTAEKMTDSWIVVFLAVIGLFLLLVTGTLGGIIVYGVDADIFTRLVGKIILGQ